MIRNAWNVFLAGAFAVPCFGQAQPLSSRTSVDIPFEFGGKPVAVWIGGALLAVDYHQTPAPVLRAFDANGKSILDYRIAISGVDDVRIRSSGFARGTDGSLAFVGSATWQDSSSGGIVAWVSPDLKRQTAIRVSPFSPSAVTVASDGTIWVAGWELVAGREVNPNHPVLRRYSRDGQLLGSFLPKSDVPPQANQLWHPAEKSRLVASRDRVGWYSEVAGLYVEFLPDGTELKRYSTVKPDPKSFVHGLALCDGGSVFASSQLHGPSGAVSGWKIFALDRQNGQWISMARTERWGMLYGCDGNDPVAQLNGGSVLTWLAPQP